MGRRFVNATKTEVDGIVFASKFEALYYQEFKIQEAAGEIFELNTQPNFILGNDDVTIMNLAGTKPREYTADFSFYRDREDYDAGILTVVETKGRMMPADSLRISVFKAFYPEHRFELIKQKKRKKRKR